MDKLDRAIQISDWQLRKHRRFSLKCPVRMKVQADWSGGEVEATCKNISIGGLLVSSVSPVPRYASVSFIISVQADNAIRPIRLVGKGKIVRVESDIDATFLIAVQCENPVTQWEEYLPQA